MWEFIKYALYCAGLIISTAFGNNYDELTWKTGTIGCLMFVVIALLLIGIYFIILVVLRKLGLR